MCPFLFVNARISNILMSCNMRDWCSWKRGFEHLALSCTGNACLELLTAGSSNIYCVNVSLVLFAPLSFFISPHLRTVSLSPIFKRKAAQNSKAKPEIFYRKRVLQFHDTICSDLTAGRVLPKRSQHCLRSNPTLKPSCLHKRADNRWRVCSLNVGAHDGMREPGLRMKAEGRRERPKRREFLRVLIIP